MKIKIVLAVIILLLAGGVGYYIYSDFARHREAPVTNISAEPTSGVGEKKNQLEQPEQRKQGEQPMIPNLDRPLNIPANLPEDAQKIAREKIEKLTSELKQNPNSFDLWLQLAIYRKMFGDYEGAREIWEYLGKINPKNPVVFNNLGDLYAYFLKDTRKAEENFLKALENGPDQIYIYRNTYEFYRYVLKDDAKAKQILERGIKANPGSSQDLQNLLNNY